MGTFTTVGVDNDLPTRQTRITMRTANDELARGIHVVFDVQTEEVEHLL